MTIQDLCNIIDMASKHFREFPSGLRIRGMNRSLENNEIVGLSYYSSMIKYLSSKGVDVSSLKEIEFVEATSGPESEDYNG